MSTAFGTSNIAVLNAPRIGFISDDTTFAGLTIGIVGRNFLPSEYMGGDTSPIVRFQNAVNPTLCYTIGSSYYVDCNPYFIEFTVPEMAILPRGTYNIQVSTDGNYWANVETGQTLSVTFAGSNPIGLNASWSKNIRWDNVYNVQEYGAIPNDSVDDTAAINNAIIAANSAGGGMVYLPAGDYRITTLWLYSNVVVVGESTESVVLYTSGGVSVNIRCTPNIRLAGVANFSMRDQIAENCPDMYISLTGDEMLFATGINIVTTLKKPLNYTVTSARRGIAINCSGNQKFILEGCYFRGMNGSLHRMYVKEYGRICDNVFDYSTGAPATTTVYLIMTGNTVQNHPENDFAEGYANGQVHGLFHRSFAYVADNKIYQSYSAAKGDGEAICAEPLGGSFSYGNVVSATANSITCVLNNSINNIDIKFGKLAIIITNGKGKGQRRLVNMDSITTTIDGGVFYIKGNWDVIPDSTSRYSLQTPVDYVTVYDNYAIDSTKGILLYGNYYDAVVANNHLVNTDGIGIFAVKVDSTIRLNTDYFVRVTNNNLEGLSPVTNSCAIGVLAGTYASTSDRDTTQAFGIEIRKNVIVSDKSSVGQSGSEMPAIPGMYLHVQAYYYVEPTTICNVIFADNEIRDSLYGFTFNKNTSGVLLSNNKLVNVDSEMNYIDPNGLSSLKNIVIYNRAIVSIEDISNQLIEVESNRNEMSLVMMASIQAFAGIEVIDYGIEVGHAMLASDIAGGKGINSENFYGIALYSIPDATEISYRAYLRYKRSGDDTLYEAYSIWYRVLYPLR